MSGGRFICVECGGVLDKYYIGKTLGGDDYICQPCIDRYHRSIEGETANKIRRNRIRRPKGQRFADRMRKIKYK